MAGTGRGAGAFSLGLLRREQVPRRGCALGSDLECPPEGASESPKEPEPQRLPRPQPWTVLVRDSPSVERGDSSLGLEPEQLGPAGFGELEREWGGGGGSGAQSVLAGSSCPEVNSGLGAGHPYSGCG